MEVEVTLRSKALVSLMIRYVMQCIVEVDSLPGTRATSGKKGLSFSRFPSQQQLQLQRQQLLNGRLPSPSLSQTPKKMIQVRTHIQKRRKKVQDQRGSSPIRLERPAHAQRMKRIQNNTQLLLLPYRSNSHPIHPSQLPPSYISSPLKDPSSS